MDDMPFHVLFSSISALSGQWVDDKERLTVCNGTLFRVEKISPPAGLQLGTARSVGQRLTH